MSSLARPQAFNDISRASSSLVHTYPWMSSDFWLGRIINRTRPWNVGSRDIAHVISMSVYRGRCSQSRSYNIAAHHHQ